MPLHFSMDRCSFCLMKDMGSCPFCLTAAWTVALSALQQHGQLPFLPAWQQSISSEIEPFPVARRQPSSEQNRRDLIRSLTIPSLTGQDGPELALPRLLTDSNGDNIPRCVSTGRKTGWKAVVNYCVAVHSYSNCP